MGLALILFVASALILPHTDLQAGESLRTSFQRDGRWALALLAAYEILATAAKPGRREYSRRRCENVIMV